MANFEVSFQTETTLDDNSTLVPMSTVPETLEFRSFLVKKPLVAIVYLVLLFVVSIWGGATNFLILLVHIMNKKINKAGRIFLVNLCLADLCVNLVAIPFCIIGVTHGEEFFQDRPILCRLIGSFCFSACVCAILNLSMATINRYTYVCHNQTYIRFFNSRNSIIGAIFIWILAVLIDTSNILGWGGYIFDRKNHSCTWDRMASFSFTLFVSFILIIGPLISIMILNTLLLRRIRATKLSICKMRDVASMRKTHNAWIETIRASRTLFIMCLVFLVCWVPYTMLVALDVNDSYPEEVHLFVTLLAHSHSATNFILYWLCNKEFSKSVYQVFRYWFSCRKSKPLASASSSELSSTSLSSGGTNAQKGRQRVRYYQSRKPAKRSDSVASTSIEITREYNSSMIRKDASGSFRGDNRMSDSIYTVRHCDASVSGTIGGNNGNT